ncbi:RraA family protein [Brevundimonas naejangsanensis]|uniref:4-hydroxy-4-methyl-2-oxoglutarate aldolase n=1 Tax=Brevundimonas naejangsanensis TaxID=588932 RepID=A0A494RKH5_9CAUL|nr:ribonuclease E activity regulator RraA [Brevundimonas naejangsanensis]AYG95060.1 RraA family protein [Brevundimonas naejangsanensis]
MTFATADLCDAHPDAVKVCHILFRSFGKVTAFHGPIRTLSVLDDNALVRETLERPGQGAVLVVNGGGSLKRALVGDNLARLAIDNGWAGIVVHGAVRDSAVLDTMDVGVKAVGTIPLRADRDGLGEIDIPTSFGGVIFTPGDWLYADADGVIVSAERLHG